MVYTAILGEVEPVATPEILRREFKNCTTYTTSKNHNYIYKQKVIYSYLQCDPKITKYTSYYKFTIVLDMNSQHHRHKQMDQSIYDMLNN